MTSLIVPLLLVTACTSINREKKILAWEAWKGRPVSALEVHPYFKTLPVSKVKHEGGIETWILTDQARFETDAYCQSLGGCIGVPTTNCDNAFSVKEGLILGLEQNGSCRSLRTIEPPKK